jgi:hypothetical protein
MRSFGPAGDEANERPPSWEGVAEGPLARGGVASRPPVGDAWTGAERMSLVGSISKIEVQVEVVAVVEIKLLTSIFCR